MAEQQAVPDQVSTPEAQAVEGAEAQAEATQSQGEKATPKMFEESYVKKLRDEAAKARAELKKIAEAQEAERHKSLAEQGKFKELFETEKAQREALAAQVAAQDEIVKATVEHELSQVPDPYRVLIPPGSPKDQLTWVRNAKAVGFFNPPAAAPAPKPNTAATAPPPAGGPPAKPEPLTPAELQELGYPYTKPERKRELRAKREAWERSLT